MRTYSETVMIIDGRPTASLDIYSEHNVFRIYEYDENVFSGSYTGAKNFIESWKAKKEDIKAFLEAQGSTVTFESKF